jgi:hypothetical protein
MGLEAVTKSHPRLSGGGAGFWLKLIPPWRDGAFAPVAHGAYSARRLAGQSDLKFGNRFQPLDK